ncbi:MAG: hypothetical protein D6797_02185 [Bdellovibrio sp.]|nr:MAG: hypothetical protein D6797_02185 [Bdellovibrio sp.]
MKSFKKSINVWNKKTLVQIGLDLAYYFVLILLIFGLLSSISVFLKSVQYVSPALTEFYNTAQGGITDELMQSSIMEELYAQKSVFYWLFAKIIIAFLIFVLLAIAANAFFKGIIWSIVLKKKFSRKFVKKYFKLMYAWLFPCFLVYVAAVQLKPIVLGMLLGIIVILFALHFSLMLNCSFDERKKTFFLIRRTLRIGINVKKLIIPYLLIIIISYILVFISLLVGILIRQPYLLAFIAFLLCSAWARQYICLVIKNEA